MQLNYTRFVTRANHLAKTVKINYLKEKQILLKVKRMKLKILTLFLLNTSLLFSNVHTDISSSYPHISGHTFRAFCDHAINNKRSAFKPENVHDGDTIYVGADHLRHFFTQHHPKIKARYILVTHDSTHSVPGNFAKYLKDEKLVRWFGKNNNLPNHPKMITIPIGLANNHWAHGKTHLIDQVMQDVADDKIEKNTLLYMNFLKSTYRSERDMVYDLFKNSPICTLASKKPTLHYLYDLAESHFVLSPRGAGVDCHRTWEALLAGSCPIVKSSFLDCLFVDLPVVIIDDWACITPEFLAHKQQEFALRTYNRERLFAPYWLDQIKAVQDAVRNGIL